MRPNGTPLPSVVETYRRITGRDALAIGKRNTVGEMVVPCVAKQNHKHGDSTASLRINLDKDAWRCDPCAAQGIEGGRSAHLAVASGLVSTLTEASRWLAPRQEPEKEIAPPPPDQQKLVAEYDYRDADGRVLYQVRRFEFEVDGKKGKTFSQRRALPGGGWEGRLGDVERVPYRFPEMIKAMGDGKTIYVVEGEKDVETLRARGITATTNAGGAGWKWTPEFVECFRSATNVVVIGDNDKAGRLAARRRAAALYGVAKTVRLVESMPGTSEKGDVTDYVRDRSASAEDFETTVAEVAMSGPFEGPERVSGPAFNFVDWSAVAIEPIEWMLLNRLPFAEFTIVEGDGGIGKTTLALDLIARLTCGRAMPDGSSHPRAHCIVIAEEDRRSTVKARLLAAGADLAFVHLVSSVGSDGHFFTLPCDVRQLRDTVQMLKARVVLIDALFNHFDDAINANKAQDVRRAIRPLIEAAHDTGAGIIGVRHWTKTRGSAAERGLGSVDLRNIARSVITVAPHPSEDDCYVAAVSKSNLGSRSDAMTYRLVSTTVEGNGASVDVAHVEWGNDLAVTANELAGVIMPSADEGAQIDVAAEFVVDQLGKGPKPSAEVYAAGKDAGIASSTLLRAAKRRGVLMTRAGFPTRSTWSLPEHDPRRTYSIDPSPEVTGASGASEASGASAEPDSTYSNSHHSPQLLHNLDRARSVVSGEVSGPDDLPPLSSPTAVKLPFNSRPPSQPV